MNKFVPIILACAMAASSAAYAQSTTTSPADAPPGAASKSPSAAAPSATSPSTSTTTPSATSPSAGSTALSDSKMMMTDAEAKQWINKTVYSNDNQNIGEIAAIKRDEAGNVTELHADIGGFLGLGETRVRLTPAQVKMEGDRIVLDMSAEQAKSLPAIAK